MEISSVKTQDEGFLVNGNMSVPNDPLNRHFQAVQEWINAGNTPDPEFTAAELATAAAIETTRLAKQTGELYSDTGITVPFTNDVANGLMQVQNGFNAAAALVAAGGMTQADHDALVANLEISETVKLPLTPATILPFSAWFWTKRSAFF